MSDQWERELGAELHKEHFNYPYKNTVIISLSLPLSLTSTKLRSLPVDNSKPFLAPSLFRSWHSRTATLFLSSSPSSWIERGEDERGDKEKAVAWWSASRV